MMRLEEAFSEYAAESLSMSQQAWAIRPSLPPWNSAASVGTCVCMQAWSSVTGRTCTVHGHVAPMQVTC